MDYEPLPKVRPIRPDAEMEQRVQRALYETAKILDEFEEELNEFRFQQPRAWVGAVIVISAFFWGGLAYALLLRVLR